MKVRACEIGWMIRLAPAFRVDLLEYELFDGAVAEFEGSRIKLHKALRNAERPVGVIHTKRK